MPQALHQHNNTRIWKQWHRADQVWIVWSETHGVRSEVFCHGTKAQADADYQRRIDFLGRVASGDAWMGNFGGTRA